jgi:hypothetical protein
VVDSHPNAGIIRLTGDNPNAPLVAFTGLRIATATDVAKEVTVLLCVATAFEGQEIRAILLFPQSLMVEDVDIERVDVGFSHSLRTTIAVAEPTRSGSFPMYGLSKTIVPLLPGLTLAFKTGSCAAALDMGTICVTAIGEEDVVCYDSHSAHDWKAGAGFPSQKLTMGSYAAEGIRVHRAPVSCVPARAEKDIGFPVEWEFSGFMKGIEAVGFVGAGREYGQASVVIDNYSSRHSKITNKRI